MVLAVSATAGCTAATSWLAVLTTALVHRPDPGPAGPLTVLAAAACTLVVARLALAAGATALTVVVGLHGLRWRGGERVALRLSPSCTRPLVALLLGTGLTATSLASPAAATGLPAPRAVAAQAVLHQSVGAPERQEGQAVPLVLPDPGWSQLPGAGWAPDAPPPRPVVAAADVRLVTAAPAHGDQTPGHPVDDAVVVRRSDTLWSVAARHLGPGASDAEVAAEWPRWWQQNRAAIGADPDHLLPGTRLRPPATSPDTVGTSADRHAALVSPSSAAEGSSR